MKLLLDTQLDILPAVFDHLPKGVSIAGQNTPAHVMSEELGVPVIEATYDGTGGDDTYTGTSGDDTINGYGGNDTLAGAGGADTIDGGDGGDILYSANVSPAWNPSYYYIAPVIPVLDTGTEIDTIRGGTGYDTIFAGYGDNVDGGADSANLLISFQGATSGVTADFNLLSNNGTMVIGGGAITNVNWVRWVDGSNYDDVITASTSGNGGSTDVRGLGGNDTLIAGYYGGNLYGGDGDDTLDGRQTLYGGLLLWGSGRRHDLYRNRVVGGIWRRR